MVCKQFSMKSVMKVNNLGNISIHIFSRVYHSLSCIHFSKQDVIEFAFIIVYYGMKLTNSLKFHHLVSVNRCRSRWRYESEEAVVPGLSQNKLDQLAQASLISAYEFEFFRNFEFEFFRKFGLSRTFSGGGSGLAPRYSGGASARRKIGLTSYFRRHSS